MLYVTRTPAPPLDRFVEVVWYCERPSAPHAYERVLPAGAVEIVIALRHERFPPDGCQPHSLPPAIVSGVYSESIVIDSSTLEGIAGIAFRPGGARPFLKVPIREAESRQIPLEYLWGSAASRVRERLLEARSPAARLTVLEQALLEVNATPEGNPAVPGDRSIAEVVSKVGYSPRRFVEMFRDEVGLTPKLFCRVRRFREAVERLRAGRDLSWAALAADCGYYDQAHLNRDFRAFAGMTPGEYVATPGDWAAHVPMVDYPRVHFTDVNSDV
jgi:AraC-like DNA-binding protein